MNLLDTRVGDVRVLKCACACKSSDENLTLCHAGEAQAKWSEVCQFELLIGSLRCHSFLILL